MRLERDALPAPPQIVLPRHLLVRCGGATSASAREYNWRRSREGIACEAHAYSVFARTRPDLFTYRGAKTPDGIMMLMMLARARARVCVCACRIP